MKFSIIRLLLIVVICSCATTPTGRKQLNLVNDSQMEQMGDASFDELKKKQKVSQDPRAARRVRCITDRLLISMGKAPSEWKVEVFEDNSPNAFALPGNNVGVHTGMLKLVKNNAQLAAVIGHEIGHVLANHGAERVSQGMVTQVGMSAAQIFLGSGSAKDQLILGALGLGTQFGVLLPFSRKHESEADELGLKYMAKAGYDPREAAQLWKLMSAGSGKTPPEFASTHPSPSTRIKKLSQLAPNYMSVYQSSARDNCSN